MPTLYICAAGHEWRSLDADTPRGGGGGVTPPHTPRAPVCPECGQPAVLAQLVDGSADLSFPAAPPLVSPIVGPTGMKDETTIFSPVANHERPVQENVPGYEILAEVGRGGMGVVYQARQLSLNRIVALKRIRHQDDITEQDLLRFRLEAEAVARLNHPHIVRIHDFGEHQGKPYISMEFIEGGSLAGRLAAGPFELREAASLVEILARAIQHAHERGIVHRDLKPGNILLQRTGPDRRLDIPRIADFGLAKNLDGLSASLSVSGVVMGTANYMAPEQARGLRTIGPAADIYALGAILYECLTGRPPFQGDSRDEILFQVIAEEPIRPTLLRPESEPSLAGDLEYICLRCLEKDPADRYPTALALADDLRRFQAGEALEARPLDEWERLGRWGRRAGYEVLELSGCTILGMVYTARQLSLNRLVTLKTISSHNRSDPEQMQRFRHEAEVMAHFHHPNIVQIHDSGECQGQPYLALEYLDGGTLADRSNQLPMPASQAVQLIRTLARATHAAHSKGVIHTDLRPFNVLMSAEGAAKITGFGLSWLLQNQLLHPGPRSRRVLSNYMAPEQASPAPTPLTPATDIHALGAMLFELLTGQPPYLAETVRGTVEQVLHAQPTTPSKLQPGIPSVLDAICLRCLRKDPAERYQSAEELAEELRRFLLLEQAQTGEFELVPGFELLEELGRGGTGVVYKARQLSLDRLVALKIFREDLARVLTTSKAVARLAHPNLVPVIDCGEREGILYVVEELVRGQTLDQLVAGTPRLPREAAGLVRILAETMNQVHNNGIIHRNLKPSVIHLTSANLLRQPPFERLSGCVPRIGSFDLALLLHPESGPEPEDRLVGTPTYMAPEQAGGQNRQVGPATDVYGLGGILYEMLTGRPAFSHDSMTDLLLLVRTRPPLPPRFCQPAVPEELEAICLRCLEKEPARRFPTAAGLAEALGQFLGGSE